MRLITFDEGLVIPLQHVQKILMRFDPDESILKHKVVIEYHDELNEGQFIKKWATKKGADACFAQWKSAWYRALGQIPDDTVATFEIRPSTILEGEEEEEEDTEENQEDGEETEEEEEEDGVAVRESKRRKIGIPFRFS